MYTTGMFVCISVYHCSLCFCLIYNLYAILTHLWYKDLHVFTEHALCRLRREMINGCTLLRAGWLVLWMAQQAYDGLISCSIDRRIFVIVSDFLFCSLYCHSSPIAAYRWEHDDWHHSACALLWQEGEGRANVWRLLQVWQLELNSKNMPLIHLHLARMDAHAHVHQAGRRCWSQLTACPDRMWHDKMTKKFLKTSLMLTKAANWLWLLLRSLLFQIHG